MKRGDIVKVYRGSGPALASVLFEAKVMAAVDGYAMVRRKGAVPFVVFIKDLYSWKDLEVPLSGRYGQ